MNFHLCFRSRKGKEFFWKDNGKNEKMAKISNVCVLQKHRGRRLFRTCNSFQCKFLRRGICRSCNACRLFHWISTEKSVNYRTNPWLFPMVSSPCRQSLGLCAHTSSEVMFDLQSWYIFRIFKCQTFI